MSFPMLQSSALGRVSSPLRVSLETSPCLQSWAVPLSKFSSSSVGLHSTGGLQKGYGVESWQIAASEISTWVADERGKTEEMEGAERQRLFNRIAPMYDNLNDWLSLGQHKVWKRMAVAWSGAKEGDSVADICCGSGDIAFLLADRVGPRGKVSGLDFAKEQLEIASQRQGDCHIASSRMEWIQGDALNLPFDDASVDAITMGYGLRNVTNIPQALHEVYRVLKPGSKASILDFNHSENPFTSSFQEWVLGSIVVPIATQFSVEEEYAYLKTSIACFPTGVKLEVLARQAGFSTAVHYEIAGGLMGVLVATR